MDDDKTLLSMKERIERLEKDKEEIFEHINTITKDLSKIVVNENDSIILNAKITDLLAIKAFYEY